MNCLWGQYQLLRKDGRQNSALQMQDHHSFAYRINHPLGEYVIEGSQSPRDENS